MPDQPFFEPPLHDPCNKPIGPFILLKTADDLDPLFFLIGAEEREVLEDIQEAVGMEEDD